MRCRMCGCTDDHACEPPCSWAPGRGNLCSSCLAVAAVVSEWATVVGHRPSFAALKREVFNAAALPMVMKIDLKGR